MEARKNILVWGSDEVVKTYGDFMRYSQNTEGMDPKQASSLAANSLESLIKAIRKDLGYKNNKILPGDVSVFLR